MIAKGDADICVADFLFAALNVPMAGRVPVVLFEHNVEYLIWKRLAQLETGPAEAGVARDRVAEGARREARLSVRLPT